MIEEVESWAKRMLLPLMEKMRDVTSQEENVNVTLRVQMCEGCHGTNHDCTNPVLCAPGFPKNYHDSFNVTHSALGCWYIPHPKTILHPEIPKSQSGKIKQQWIVGPTNLRGPYKLWSMHHVAAILLPHFLERFILQYSESPEDKNSRYSSDQNTRVSPFHSTPIHTQLSYVGKYSLESHKSLLQFS